LNGQHHLQQDLVGVVIEDRLVSWIRPRQRDDRSGQHLLQLLRDDGGYPGSSLLSGTALREVVPFRLYRTNLVDNLYSTGQITDVLLGARRGGEVAAGGTKANCRSINQNICVGIFVKINPPFFPTGFAPRSPRRTIVATIDFYPASDPQGMTHV